MDKRSYFLNNLTSEIMRIVELNLSLPPGISNLFILNPDLTFEQIDYSLRNGTLRAAMDNKLCLTVPDIVAKSISDVIIRNPYQVQVFQNRIKFPIAQVETDVFDAEEDADLFTDNLKPARQIEAELKQSSENIQNIEATVRDANLPEKPIENRYTSIEETKYVEAQQKIKNDLKMGYETCHGKTAAGKKCLRQAKTGKKFCGLHKSQE